MKKIVLKKILTTTALLLTGVYANSLFAHSVGGPIDSAGNNPSATHFGYINCYDNGVGPTNHLFVQIKDLSPPVPGLLLNVQISKGQKMTNVTDAVSGDDQPSPGAILAGGNGVYNISINKTAAGVRNFDLTYHCQTLGNDHTGTDEVGAFQLQL